MLPLLPALLLLLLQGPSNFERSTVDGRLPAALEVIHRQMARPSGVQLSESDEKALASLLAAGIDRGFPHALIAYLRHAETCSVQRPVLLIEDGASAFPQHGSVPLQDGFTQCSRTRDGPSTIASLA